MKTPRGTCLLHYILRYRFDINDDRIVHKKYTTAHRFLYPIAMEISTVVIDNGSCFTRAGLSGNESPSVVIPTIIGHTNVPKIEGDMFASKDIYVGSDVFSSDMPNLDVLYPIRDRSVEDYGEIEKIWDYVFSNGLSVDTKDHPVIITEGPLTSDDKREKSIEIMMEKFSCPAYYSALPELLSLFNAGQTTGIVVDSGYTITDVIPIFECFPMTNVFQRIPIGGSHINFYLKRLLMQSGIELSEIQEQQTLNDIKEKLCYVPFDLEEEQHKYEHVNEIERTYKMPYGNKVHIGAQRFRCAEPIFDPRLIQVQSDGIVKTLYDTIHKCGDLKQEMFQNIVLSGGNAQFPGLDKRIKKDLEKLTTNNPKLNVRSGKNNDNAAWRGGSVLASQISFSLMWITKEEYQEVGPHVVTFKCF